MISLSASNSQNSTHATHGLAVSVQNVGLTYTTSIDMVNHVKEVTPDSLNYLIKDMFETITLYQNRVVETKSKKLDNGKYETDAPFIKAALWQYIKKNNPNDSNFDKSKKMFELLELTGRLCRKRNISLPFGGIQIIFSGDFYQLPPVGDIDDDESCLFCFESELFDTIFENKISKEIVKNEKRY